MESYGLSVLLVLSLVTRIADFKSPTSSEDGESLAELSREVSSQQSSAQSVRVTPKISAPPVNQNKKPTDQKTPSGGDKNKREDRRKDDKDSRGDKKDTWKEDKGRKADPKTQKDTKDRRKADTKTTIEPVSLSGDSKYGKAIKFKKFVDRADDYLDDDSTVTKRRKVNRKKKKGGDKYTTKKTKKPKVYTESSMVLTTMKEETELKHREKRRSRDQSRSDESTSEKRVRSKLKTKKDEANKKPKQRSRERVDDKFKSDKSVEKGRKDKGKTKFVEDSSREPMTDEAYEDQSTYQLPSEEYEEPESAEPEPKAPEKEPDWSQYIDEEEESEEPESQESDSEKNPSEKTFKKVISKTKGKHSDESGSLRSEPVRKTKKSFKKIVTEESEYSAEKHPPVKPQSPIEKRTKLDKRTKPKGKPVHSSEESEESSKLDRKRLKDKRKQRKWSVESKALSRSKHERSEAELGSDEHHTRDKTKGKVSHKEEEEEEEEEKEEEEERAHHVTFQMTTRQRKVRKFKITLPPGRNQTNTLLGTRSFYDLVTKSDAFVDKTELITDILCDEKILHFTRPRKWGRSMTIDMLKRFFELELDDYGHHLDESEKVNKKLFRGGIKIDLIPELDQMTTPKLRRKKKKLAVIDAIRYRTSPALKISEDKKAMMHLGKYPVMVFNFKNLRGDNYNAVMLAMKNLIHLQFKRYSWLLKRKIGYANKRMYIEYLKMSMPDDQYIKTGINFITKMVHKIYKKRVVFFIDDEDYPVVQYLKNNYFDKEGLEKIHSMTKEFINKLVEDPNIHQGIIFGTMHIKQLNPPFLPESYMPYSVNDPSYNTLLGFTDEEVDRLLVNKSLPVTKRDLKKWYSGYNVGGKELYNPWSVLNCIHNGGKLAPYFTNMPGYNVGGKELYNPWSVLNCIHNGGKLAPYFTNMPGYNVGGKELYNPWSVLNCIHNGGKLAPYFTNMPGYNVGGKELYNPWSVLNCIHNGGKLAPYFTNMPGYNVGGKELYNPWSVLNCIHNGGKLAPYFTNMPGYNVGGKELFNPWSVLNCIHNGGKLAPYFTNMPGYNVGGKELFNPWSVLNCIHNGGKLAPYFTNMPYTRVLRKGIPREVIMKLIHDEGVSVAFLHQLANFNYIRTYQVFIKSLMHAGYLTNFQNKLYIPNKEIYNFYSNSSYFKRLNQTRSVEKLEIMHKKEGI
ncbi:hypothetical protein M8J76_000716 [Diaphorina citri]|nr:hypothetical protein M8J76_000716 [Diaphorina citri]